MSAKETPPKYPSGFLTVLPEVEKCDASQEQMITEFVSTYLTSLPDCYQYLASTPKSMEDKRIVAYKYLMARKWKMEDAAKMFNDTVAWRESHKYHKDPYFPSAIHIRGYDEAELRKIFDMPERSTNERIDAILHRMRIGYKFGIHKWDKQGHPVLIDLTGRIAARKTITALKELTPPGKHISEPFVQLRAYQNELCQFLVRARDMKFQDEQRAQGVQEPLRRVTCVTAIMDMSGLSRELLSTELIETIKSMLAATQAYYPEMSYRTFVVNCSSLVMFAFNIIKGWLDPRARNKLVFCSVEETPHVLRAVIDAEHLPRFLGGTCECANDCVCSAAELVADHSAPEPDTTELGSCGDKTVEIHVSARGNEVRSIKVFAGETVAWHWDIPTKGHDVLFTATFENGDLSSGSKPVVVVAAEKLSTNIGEYKASHNGTFTLRWDNDYSWVTGKLVRARLAKLEK